MELDLTLAFPIAVMIGVIFLICFLASLIHNHKQVKILTEEKHMWQQSFKEAEDSIIDLEKALGEVMQKNNNLTNSLKEAITNLREYEKV